jgi:tRNA nucleotidyltransferase/poly(A) polymerase/2'-5' RNA ligase
MGKLNDFINNIKQKPFIQSLINNLKSDVYVVGGAVRDLILNKQNKDIDLIVGKVSINMLILELQKFGKVDVVGKSFGVIKFIDSDGIDYDIALPRKDTKNTEGGYRGFDVQSDENLPIEDELIRRDAKMNAMAININTGKFIDPLGGLEDIKNKQISAANPEVFSDDPLRMIRMIGFASRFGFTIEPETMKMIQSTAGRIKEIPPERILTEFDKIVNKGNVLTGAILLDETGLLKEIFGRGLYYDFRNTKESFDKVKTMGEFIYLLSKNLVNESAAFYKTNLKGDIPTFKEIKALEMAFDAGEATNLIEARSVVHNMYLISPQSLESQILPNIIKVSAQELLEGKYPKTINELAVNGNDLMELGLKDKEIGNMQKSLLLKVYANNVRNNREDLLNLASQNKSMIKEEISERIEYGCLMLFLDVPIWNKITSIINKEDIYNKEGYGIEKEPHLTILYGFHDEVTADDVFNLYKENAPLKPIEVLLSGISVFENPEYDVVKFDAHSDILTKMNEVMKQLPNTSKFPDYHPHVTIAYVKKGEGQKYIRLFEKERTIKGNELVYSWKGHKGKEDGKILKLNENVINEQRPNFKYQVTSSLYEVYPEDRYLIGAEQLKINYLVKKYDEWNKNNKNYLDPTRATVLEFLQKNYPDLVNDEELKKDLYWKLIDREVLNETINKEINKFLMENKSDYEKEKTALLRSKSISKEMKEEILKYFGGGTKYHEGGHVHGLTMPKELIDKTPKAKGVSMGADKDGFFVYTHRQRSKSYESPEKISIKDINFTESTG